MPETPGAERQFTLPTRADHRAAADALWADLMAQDNDAQWRIKWMHPAFHGQGIDAVRRATLTLADAEATIASGEFVSSWDGLLAWYDTIDTGGPEAQFEAAANAVIGGDLATLNSLLDAHPALIVARSSRRHRATLLHYVACNGVENWRQHSPENAVDVARLLLTRGAEVDALADMYNEQCTTMSMLVSSSPPAARGVQLALAELLLDHGAQLDGAGSKWSSAVMTALTFGFLGTAQGLARRGAALDHIALTAGLGDTGGTARLLPVATHDERHMALSLAAQHGQVATITQLLDAGADINRLNCEGFHSHATPLHSAIAAGQAEAVRALVARGARIDIADTLYGGYALDWAEHCEQPAIAAWLRDRGAQNA
jgi:ankyrin repeat protein